MKKSILLLFAAFATLVANAHDFEVDGIYYNITSETDHTVEVTYKGDYYGSYDDEYSGSITIPATVTYGGVKYSVTSIGDEAFSGCSSLATITLPEGVTSIGEWAFSDCTSLTAITIPEDSKLTSIEEYAFYECSSLTAITIPEGVTSIGGYAFQGCSSLAAITLPESVTSIGDGAFYKCRSLTAITLPKGVTGIGEYAFSGCSDLTSIVLPKSVEFISSKAFANCAGLTDVYCYAETVPDTEANAFNGSYIEYATLHVPAIAMNDYKATAPWSSFGTIVCLTEEDMSIEQLTNDNSQQTIYDLCGRRVTDIEKGGVYIVGGKKVIIK